MLRPVMQMLLPPCSSLILSLPSALDPPSHGEFGAYDGNKTWALFSEGNKTTLLPKPQQSTLSAQSLHKFSTHFTLKHSVTDFTRRFLAA
jgi:hypothetical protein